MEKFMVIVFEDETKAHHGIRALRRLDSEGSVTIHAGALVRKDETGTVVLPDKGLDDFPVQTLAGTSLGAVIGVLAGPAGVVAGAGMGAMAGLAGDMTVGSVDDEVVGEVSRQLQSGKCAVVLDITEDWVTPVDSDLESYASAIYRRPKVDVEEELTTKRIEADQKEMDALEQEWRQAREEDKARIHSRMEDLKNRNKRRIEQLQQRQERIGSQNKAKVKELQKKISGAKGEMRKRFQDLGEELNREDQEFQKRMDRSKTALQEADRAFTEQVNRSIAQGLHKAAEHFEGKKAA